MAALDTAKSLPSLAEGTGKQRSSPRKRLSAIDISLPAPIPEGKLSGIFKGKLQLPTQMTSQEELESFMRQPAKKESEVSTLRGLYATIRKPGGGKNGNTSKSGRSVSMPTDQVSNCLSTLDLHMRKYETSPDQDQVTGSCPTLSEEVEAGSLAADRLSSLFSNPGSSSSIPGIPGIPGSASPHPYARRMSSSSSGSGSVTPQSRRFSVHSSTNPLPPTLASIQAAIPRARKTSLLDLEKHLTVMEFLEEGPPTAKISPAASKESSRRGSMCEIQTVSFAIPTTNHVPGAMNTIDDGPMEICEFLSSQPPTPSTERKMTPNNGVFTLPAESNDDVSGLTFSPKPHKRAVSAAALPLVKLISGSPTFKKRLSNPALAMHATNVTSTAQPTVSASATPGQEFFSQARKPESMLAASAGPIIQAKDSACNIFGGDLPPVATPVKVAELVFVASTPAAQPVTKVAAITATAPTPMPSSPRMVAAGSTSGPCVIEASSSEQAPFLDSIPTAIIHETPVQAANRKKRLAHRRARSGSVDGAHIAEHVTTGIAQLAKPPMGEISAENERSTQQQHPLKSASLPDLVRMNVTKRERRGNAPVDVGGPVVRLERDLVWPRVDDASSLLAMPEAQCELAALRVQCDVHTVWPLYLEAVNSDNAAHQAQARTRISSLQQEIDELRKTLESRQ